MYLSHYYTVHVSDLDPGLFLAMFKTALWSVPVDDISTLGARSKVCLQLCFMGALSWENLFVITTSAHSRLHLVCAVLLTVLGRAGKLDTILMSWQEAWLNCLIIASLLQHFPWAILVEPMFWLLGAICPSISKWSAISRRCGYLWTDL